MVFGDEAFVVWEGLNDCLEEVEFPDELFTGIVVDVVGLEVHLTDGVDGINFYGLAFCVLQESIDIVILIPPQIDNPLNGVIHMLQVMIHQMIVTPARVMRQ